MPTRSACSRRSAVASSLDAVVVVAALADREKLERREVARDHLLEADLALDVVAKRHRPRNQADLARPAGEEAAEQARRGAPGRGIVDADVVGAARARRVGDQRHHGHAGRGQFVDRLAHGGMVERHHGDAVDLALQPVECRGEHVAVENVDKGHSDPHPLVSHVLRRHPHALRQRLHEGVAAGREDELEAVLAAAGEPRGEPVGPVLELGDRLLDALGRLGMDTRPPVEHPVDGSEAHARGPGHVLKCRARQMICSPQWLIS